MRSDYLRLVAVANATVLLVGVLSIGQVQHELRDEVDTDTTIGFGPDSTPLPGTTASPGPHASGGPSSVGNLPSASPGAVLPGGTTGTGGGTTGRVSRPGAPFTAVPDLDLRTQGVTPTSVLIGLDYNKSGCGGAGALANQFGAAVAGDMEKSVAAFVRHINDTGGIRGRTLKVVTVDDGGLGCPERHQAAAIELVEQRKVFMDIAGLHEVSDLLWPKRLPFYGGRSTKAEQAKQGMGQFQLYQDADGDFLNWAAFGRNYLNAKNVAPCLIHPDTDDFNNLEKLIVKAMTGQGLRFRDIVRYADDPSTAQQQATTYSIEMSNAGCKQVWLIANNFLADVFFTRAAAQQQWYPIWTWTARTAGIDFELAGRLMDQSEWAKAVGLTTRIKPGQSPYDGQCKRIYNRYNAGDGQDGSAAVQVACQGILVSAEAMRRAVDVTGVLTGSSLMVGVDAIRGDFSWDAFVPLTYDILGKASERDFTGYDLQTVARWNTKRLDYDFPEWPRYWKVLGPKGSGAVDIRPLLRAKYTPPKR